MKPTQQTFTFKIARKILILTVLCLGWGVLFFSDTTADARTTACFDAYGGCHAQCDVPRPNDPNWDADAIANCHRSCLLPYGDCVNQAELDKEGELMTGYEEGQPIPLLQDFQLCITNCGTCLIEDPDPVTCAENYMACKIACIESF